MIRLDEVAIKIQNILNGTDPEVIQKVGGVNPPTGFQFVVRTEGFYLNEIADMKTGKNFIPVFISSMGGNFNPVPDLMQANYVIPITFYFPVRFKEDAFKLNEYLARIFVGRQLNYGANSGIAISNISVAQYGEIVDLDLKQFAEWVQTNYREKVEVMEPFIQMTISLYLSTAADGFVYGNDVTATLSIESDDPEAPSSPETLVFVQTSVQSNSEPAVQQILDEEESEGLPTGTSYGASPSIYIKDNAFFRYLLDKWFSGESQTMTLNFNLEFLGSTFTRRVFIQSVNMLVQKGELATITLAFTKKAVVE